MELRIRRSGVVGTTEIPLAPLIGRRWGSFPPVLPELSQAELALNGGRGSKRPFAPAAS